MFLYIHLLDYTQTRKRQALATEAFQNFYPNLLARVYCGSELNAKISELMENFVCGLKEIMV